MNKMVLPGPRAGTLPAIASKSQAHRLLICAALGKSPVRMLCAETSQDIEATARCLNALGADIRRTDGAYEITPIATVPAHPVLDVGESGSTLRFLLPVVGALGAEARLVLHGRLPQRPLSPLWEELEAHGMTLHRDGANIITGGHLCAGEYALPGNISSQYISGLLFALPLLNGNSEIRLTTEVESGAYLTMTEQALERSGIVAEKMPRGWRIPGHQQYHGSNVCAVEGDWSNAAFPLCAGALSGEGITVTNLNLRSPQGDRAVVEILRRFGADVQVNDDAVTARPGKLRGITVDAAEIPDLVPVLTAVAVAATGETRFIRAGRLRIKESDRLKTVCALFTALGADICETDDGLMIRGGKKLTGGTVDAAGDHRIAMTAAVAAAYCTGPVEILGAEAVAKSYPGFWDDWSAVTVDR
jgi:3-phosphoshikimate 1-carboxyvinyltransferase